MLVQNQSSKSITGFNFYACTTSDDEIFDGWTLGHVFVTNNFSLDIVILDWNTDCFHVLNIALGKPQRNFWPYQVFIKWFERRIAMSSTFSNVDHISEFWSYEKVHRSGNIRQFQNLGKWYPKRFKLTRHLTLTNRIKPPIIRFFLYQRLEVHFIIGERKFVYSRSKNCLREMKTHLNQIRNQNQNFHFSKVKRIHSLNQWIQNQMNWWHSRSILVFI